MAFDFEPLSDETAALLRNRAAGAVAGPWSHDNHIVHEGDTPGLYHVFESGEDDPPLATCPREEDARYIAVADPTTILALLDEQRALRTALQAWATARTATDAAAKAAWGTTDDSTQGQVHRAMIVALFEVEQALLALAQHVSR